MLKKFRETLNKQMGRRDQVKSDLSEAESSIEFLTEEIKKTEEAQRIIQFVAAQTQGQLKYLVEPPVNQGLAAVFDRPYEFELRFETKAGRTQAEQIFKRDGKEYKDLMFSGGGGAVDTAAFGCQVSGLYLTPLRRFLMLDEPLKHLKSKDKVLESRGALMITETSHELDLQVLMISHIPEQQEGADKVFYLTNKKGVTEVKEG